MKLIKKQKSFSSYIDDLIDKNLRDEEILIPISYLEEAMDFLKLKRYRDHELIDHFYITGKNGKNVWIRTWNKEIIICVIK